MTLVKRLKVKQLNTTFVKQLNSGHVSNIMKCLKLFYIFRCTDRSVNITELSVLPKDI